MQENGDTKRHISGSGGPFTHPPTHLSTTHQSIHRSTHLSNLSPLLSTHPSNSSIHPPIHLLIIHPSEHPFNHQSIHTHPSIIHPPTHTSTHPPTRPPIHLFTIIQSYIHLLFHPPIPSIHSCISHLIHVLNDNH